MTKSKAIAIFLEIYSDRFTDEEKMKAICAVRYALGRRTWVPDDVATIIKRRTSFGIL